MSGTLQPMPGVCVGHWTDLEARTGCTVIRFDEPALTAVDVRGAAPGSRELDLLGPGQRVQRPDAILLAGGSAMGLGAADGVMRWMRERGRGFPTSAGPVPIVPAAVIFDLANGRAVWPDADAGYISTEAAVPLDRAESGRVGAGTGATIASILGGGNRRPGGIGIAQMALDDGTVTAVAVVNAFGAPHDEDTDPRHLFLERAQPAPLGENTTLLACITNVPLDHGALTRMTVAMHDGLARSIVPAHTSADGDIAFASTTSEGVSTPPDRSMRASLAAELAVEHAIAAAIMRSRTASSV